MSKKSTEALAEIAVLAAAEATRAGHDVGDFRPGYAMNSRFAETQTLWTLCLSCNDSIIAFADGEIKYPPKCIKLPRPPSESGWF
jgi:hypothetical protein